MKNFTNFIKMLAGILAIISMISGYFMMWAAGPFFLVLLVLKAINFQGIFWFGWPSTMAVFTTPLWLALGGLLLLLAAVALAALADFEINSKYKIKWERKIK